MRSGTQLFPEVASTMATRVDALYLFLVGLTAFFTLLIFTLFVVYMVKYRRRDPNSVGARIHRAMERGADVVYAPGFWRPVMAGVRAIPERLFKRMRL